MRDVNCDINNMKYEEIKKLNYKAFICGWNCYQSNKDYSNYRLFYVNPMVTSKKTLVLDIQKIKIKKSKHTITTKNH
jgi:hypothetical protein